MKVVYVINFPNLEALQNREHVYVSSVHQEQIGASCTTFKRYCERRHGWRHSTTHKMTLYTTWSHLLTRLHSHTLSLPKQINCSLQLLSLRHLVTHWNSHSRSQSRTLNQSLSQSQKITVLEATTDIMSMNQLLPLNHCHYLNESVTRTTSLS